MRLETIDQFKPLVGKVICAIPTGNNARHNKDTITEFKVLSVKRKYVSLASIYDDIEGRADNYSPKSGATQDAINSGFGGNSGYIFFDTKEAVTAYKEHNENISKIKKLTSYSYGSILNDLSNDDALLILDVLSKYGDSND